LSATNGKFIQNGTITFNKFGQNGATLGQVIAWNGSLWVPVTQGYELLITATQQTTSNAYASVTGLVTPTLPVGYYRWKLTGLAQSAVANTGVGVRISNVTAVVGVCYGRWQISQAIDGTAKAYQYDQLTSATNVTSASVQTTNTDLVVLGEGVVQVTTAGTIAVQLRSETNGNQVSLRNGTLLRLEPIG
jgi:hypothetical protein